MAHATPLAGSFITNQAGGSYTDTASGTAQSTLSNIVRAVVQQVASFTLGATQSKNAAAGGTVYFPHVLTNTGNGPDVFNLAITDVFAGGFNLSNLNLYLDANGDGVPDNLTPLASTGSLAAGGVFRFVAGAQVPATAPGATQDQITVTASGTASAVPASAKSVVDTAAVAAVVAGPELVLQKTHVGDFTINNNSVYTLTVRNLGNQPTNNVVIVTDTLPPGLVFVPSMSGGTSWTCSSTGQVISCNSPTIVPAQAGATPGVHPNPLSIAVKPDGTVLTALPVTLTNNAVVSGGGEPAANAGNNAAADPTVVQASANLTGRVWRDVNHDRVFTPDEAAFVLPGWKVELCSMLPAGVCDATNLVASVVTAADGTYVFNDLPAGDYKLQFRDPNNSAVSGKPVNGDNGTPQAGSALDPNRRFLFITLKPGGNLARQSLPLDPSGVVFDSVTRKPIAGAKVVVSGPPGFDPAIHLLGGLANVTQITGPGGFYQYLLLAGFPQGGPYTLTVTSPADYLPAPSVLFPPNPGLLDPPVGCTIPAPPIPAVCSVDSANSPNAPATARPSYFMSFTLNAGDLDVVNNHIPLDRRVVAGGSGLLVSKISTKLVAEIGDFVDYIIKVQNASAAQLPAVSLRDTLPFGFAYVDASARLNGVAISPAGPGSPASFALGALAANSTVTLTYRLQLLPGAQLGDGINRAQASSGTALSNVASVKVRVQGGVFSEKAYAIGKVFLDCNLNGVQDTGELGMPGVRLYLQDGTNVTTDVDGKYSLYGLAPRTHVLKVDATTLPAGAQLVVISNRQAGDAGSRFLDLKNGELHKADFALACTPEVKGAVESRREAAAKFTDEAERVLKERLRTDAAPVIPSDVRGQPAAGVVGGATGAQTAPARSFDSIAAGPLDSKNSNLPPVPSPSAAAMPLEKMIAELDNTLGFIGMKDGDTVPYTQTAVRVKGPFGAQFKLTVNGTEVGATRVGAKLSLEDKNIQIWEYIGVALKPGVNMLSVAQLDSFGNIRGSQVLKLIAPADLGKIVIDAPREAPADGSGLVKIKINLTDDKGVPVTVRTALTLESTRARWQAEDLNKNEAGIQVFIEGGSAEFALLAPVDAGDDVLHVSSGILNAEHKISFLPDLRPMIAVGVIEGAINFRSLNFRNLVSPRQRDSFEQEIQRFSQTDAQGRTTAAARAAVFLKGQVKGEYLLTLAYDSDKDLKGRLFRDIQPDEFYPIYGDSSVRAFDAQSTQRLYVRVDHGKSFVLYGDFMTSQPSEARKLSDYSRSMTGLQGRYENNNLLVNAFASEDTQRQLVEEFPANGTSGPFQLSNRNGVINSEKVEILTRDRNQPAIILKTEPQSRFSDYEIESFTGRILFKGPVASLDQDLNAKSIRVVYEIDQGGDSFWVSGLSAQYKLFSNLEVGASYVTDRNPLAPFQLSGLNTTLKLGEKTFVTGELARSDSLKGVADARRIELHHEDANLNVRLSAATADIGFDNPSSQLNNGRSEVTGRATYKLDQSTSLSAEVLRTEDMATQGRREGVLVGAQHSLENGVKIDVGVRHSRETAAAAQPASVLPSAARLEPTEVTSARVRVTATLPDMPQATVFGEYEQSISDSDRKVAAIGANYQLAGSGKLYARHEFISSLSTPFALDAAQRNNVTVIGIDTEYAKDNNVFSEYRIRDSIDERTAEAAIGLRNGYQIGEGLKLSTSFERVHAFSGSNSGESRALATGLEYTANPRLKASTRLEWRQSTQSDSMLVSLGGAYKLDDDWSALARGIHTTTENKGTASGALIQTRLQAGLAYRDSATNVWSGLGRVEYRNEGDTTELGAPLKRSLLLGSMHFNYQPERALLFNGRVAGKFVTDDSFGLVSKSEVYLLSGRMTVDLSRDWDVSVQASVLASRGFSDRQVGLGAEVGYQMADNLWLSAGYNLFGFKEKDISPDINDNGFFIRLRYKFDENIFKPSKDKAPSIFAHAQRVAAAPLSLIDSVSSTLTAQAPSQPGPSSVPSAPASDAAPVPNPQVLLGMAGRLIKEGKGAQAYAMLKEAEPALIGDTEFDYLLGVAALDAGKPDQASLALSRVIAANPVHAGARVDLARAYIALGQQEMAVGELEGAIEFDPPPATRNRIEDLLKDVRPSGKLTAYVAAGAGYDDNYNNATSQSQIYVPFFGGNLTLSPKNVQSGASFTSLAGGLAYTYDFDSRLQAFAGLDVSRRGLSGASDFDPGSIGVQAGASLKLGRHQLKAALQRARTEVGGGPDRDLAGVSGEWAYSLVNGDYFALSARHSQARSAIAALNIFDADTTAYGATYAGSLGRRANWSLALITGDESDINGNPYGARSFYSAQIAGEYKLRGDLSATAGLTFQRSLWDQGNIAFQTERVESRYDLTVGLNWRFADGWSLQPRFTFNDNQSNIPMFSFRRNEISLTIRRDIE